MLQNLFYDYLIMERGLSKNTLLAYKRDIEHFFDHFKTLVVEDEGVIDYLHSLECSKRTLARKISSLKSLYKFLLANNYVEFSPMELIVGVKIDKKIPSFLTSEDIKEISKVFTSDFRGVRDKLVFDLLIHTGTRISEILNLKLSDIDFENNSLRILGKGDKTRIVPINSLILESVKEYIEEFRELFIPSKSKSELLFPNISRNNYWLRLKNYVKKAGIEKNIYPHIFRHSFATIMLSNGANIRHVQEMLGHSSVSTTEIYTHVSKNKLKNIHDSIDFRGKDERES